jgi:uncharacterized protein (DUF1499 family)
LSGEAKTSTKVLLVSALALLVVLLTGPLGYKFDLVPLEPSLISLLIALVGGALVSIIGFVYLIIALRNEHTGDRNLLVLVIFLGLLPSVFVLPQMSRAQSVPAIHDITTDTDNPPTFVAVVPLRKGAPNPVDYGTEEWPAQKLGAATMQAYPDLEPLRAEMSVADAIERAETVLLQMGLEIVAKESLEGRLEATATTFWFGFKDDVVIRIVGDGEEAVIDLRSKSRVGQSDIGANADRIREFIRRF